MGIELVNLANIGASILSTVFTPAAVCSQDAEKPQLDNV